VIEGLSVAITVWHRVAPDSFQLLTLNEAAARLLELDRENLPSLTIAQVFPQHRTDVVASLSAVLSDGERRHLGELRYGDEQSPDLVLMGEAFAVGESGVAVMLEDIPERLWVENTFSQSEELWRTMMESAPGYIFATDLDGNILLANRAPAGLLPEHLVGMSVLHYAPEESRDLLQGLLQETIASQKPNSIETEGASGRWYRLEVGPMVRGGRVFGLVTIQLDITDRKNIEIELEAKNAELGQSNRELEEFAYAASHDLQEPLRMVSSFAELLRDEYEGELNDEADRFIGYIVDGATRMQLLVRDLLRLSRVATRSQPAAAVNLSDVLRAVRQDLEMASQEASATFDIGALPVVLGDRTQLHQLFLNLIGNALKFRGEKPAHLTITAQRIGARWTFEVRDHGVGFEMRFAERVFRVFQRLHRDMNVKGTGIGLAICKKIVERHGGLISAESEPGKGTTFRFTLPAVVEAAS